ncbi:MAG: hypothetical protein ACM3SY_12560 [Candidatus Omnitrophota bacterium]
MKCFVIMPFGDPEKEQERARQLDFIFSGVIKPCVESIEIPGREDEKIFCHRADKSARPDEIITHIVENLVLSDIVIADLSGRNPNVFYELGVRHAVNNNTILIADNLDDVPFDLRGLRTITYKWDPEKIAVLQQLLKEAILEILNEPDKIDNPIRRYLYNREVDKLIKQPLPGYEVIKNILTEMSSLKKAFNEQFIEIKSIVNQITSGKNDNLDKEMRNEYDLKFFEGNWHNERSGSIIFAKVNNGELLMPYLYGFSNHTRAHYYNCKLIGNTLFARFEWFSGTVSGYVFLNIKSENELIGGWWASNDVPEEMQFNITEISERIPGMVPVKWKKIKEKINKPEWVEDYYKGKLPVYPESPEKYKAMD